MTPRVNGHVGPVTILTEVSLAKFSFEEGVQVPRFVKIASLCFTGVHSY